MTPPLSRRRLLAVTGATAVAGLAGCLGRSTDDPERSTDGSERSVDGPGTPEQSLALGTVHQYSSPGCGCCGEYAEYLRDHVDGDVSETVPDDIDSVKHEHDVPADLHGCHTVVLEDYVVEGHVPLAAVERLRAERPAIDGIALPGMPQGSPGMPGEVDGELTVYAFSEGQRDAVFATF